MATKRTFIPLLIVMTLGASLLGSGLAGVALAETPKKTPTAGRQQGAPVKTQLPGGTVIITVPGGDTLTKLPDGTEIMTRPDGSSTERRLSIIVPSKRHHDYDYQAPRRHHDHEARGREHDYSVS